MERLRTRNDIMEWLEEHAPYPSIKRAVVEGTTELLGVFDKITSKNGRMAWIIKVTSKHNRVWYVAIIPDGFHHCFRCRETSEPSWEYWMGDIVNGGLGESGPPLYVGDNPKQYKELKDDAKKRKSDQV